MARPRQFDAVEVESALLDVFWSRGYARTSLDDLAAATGLQRGSLYAAYASKEDMFRAAIRRYTAELAAAIASRKRGLDGAAHLLRAVARVTVRDRQRRGCLVLNAIPESHGLSRETQRALQAALDSMQALLRARLREAQADAGTRLDLDPLVAMLFGAAVAIRVLGRAGHQARLLHDIADGTIEAARRCFANEKE